MDDDTHPSAEPEPPQETLPPLAPPAAIPTAEETYKQIVASITEMAKTPEFRATFKEYLNKINPDGDKIVSGQEMADFLQQSYTEIGQKYNALLAKEIPAGASPEDIAKAFEEAGITRLGTTGTPHDYSVSASMERAASECRQNTTLAANDPVQQQLQQILDNYPQIVTALQVRSSIVGDLFLSEETKALIPKLNPEDAYSLPLFVQMPTQEQKCEAIAKAAVEVSHSDPLRPMDTPTAPAEREPTQTR